MISVAEQKGEPMRLIDGDKLKCFMEITGGAEQQMLMATFDLNRKKTVTVKKKDKKTYDKGK